MAKLSKAASMMANTKDKANFRTVPKAGQNFTAEKLKGLLPKGTNKSITDEVLRQINRMEEDTGLPQALLEEDLASTMHILGGSSHSISQLVTAIKYCNLKRHYDNKKSWSIVFPEKYDELKKIPGANIDNYVSMYNKSKIVTAVDKEMMIPVSVAYMAEFHRAVRELHNIGVMGRGGKDAKGKEMTVTPMVKVQALKELIAITKPPEEQQIAITLNQGDAALSAQEEMNRQLKEIVMMQRKELESGSDIIDVQAISGLDFSEVGKGNE